MNYGMPYMGSKNRIAESLIRQLPPAKHFYDMFGGGGAMSHCALLSGKYQYIHYNELDPLVFKGFKMFVNGEFKNENRWISREDFNRLKDTDPYVAICFSFGNDTRTYAFEREREKEKKAFHYSICFNDNTLLSEYTDLTGFGYCSDNLKIRRLELKSFLNGRLQSLERLERLNSFNADTTRIILTNKSYNNVEIEPDSVIYCDPPYLGTKRYKSEFDYDKFYEWLRNNPNKIYISEYSMPDDFCEIYRVNRTVVFNYKVSKISVEKLFTNKPVPNPLEF